LHSVEAAAIDQTSDQMAAPFQLLLEPAGRVAALVEAVYRQPEQRAMDTLELAQAAATRSCANLRCPNVAGQGREAEGRRNQVQVLSLPCRAILLPRVQRGRLKAGHRWVCAELGAAAAAEAGAAAAASTEQAG
jgi:hypothetical protein